MAALSKVKATRPCNPPVQPRIEPEIVFKLCRSLPKTDHPAKILQSVEWFAPGFEIVQCHFPDWKFSAADCIADFGLHGLLVLGSPVQVAGVSCTALASELSQFAVALSCGSTIGGHGSGSLVLGSPLIALVHLNRKLERSGDRPLAGGEVVTTGTLTDAWPVLAGEAWSADYTTLGTQSMSVRFV